MKTIIATIASLAFAVLPVSTNANPPASPGGNPQTAAPSPHAAGGPADMSKSDAPLTRKGKVLAIIDTKGFTYMEVQDGRKKLWVVSPTIAAKNGNSVSFADAPTQAKYHSPSLNRDFSNVIFTTRVVIDK